MAAAVAFTVPAQVAEGRVTGRPARRTTPSTRAASKEPAPTAKPKIKPTIARDPSLAAVTAEEHDGLRLLFASMRERIVDTRADGRDVNTAIAGANDFTVKLFKAVAVQQAGRNVVTGPYTALFALGMAYGGANAKTAEEMASVLGATGLPGERWHAAINNYDLTLAARLAGSGVEWTAANKVWLQRGFTPSPAYLDLLAGRYGSALAEADFTSKPDAERQSINTWTKRQTKERIPELFPPDTIGAGTRLVLVNAVALDAPWNIPFDPALTRPGPFRLADGLVVAVPMMSYNLFLPSGRGPDFTAVELPYKGGQLVMDLIVPTDLKRFEAELTATSLAERLALIKDGGIHLSVPKFSTRTHADLNDILKDMGMPSAFAGADFSGITGGPNGLFIESVQHEAFIAVDEDGTKAAAATGVAMALSHGPTVTVDRPFLYVIRDKAAGTILFMGRVMDPSKTA